MRLLKPAFISFFRQKQLFLYILSIAIIIGVLMVIFAYRESLEEKYTSEIENNIINRTIFVSKDNSNALNIKDIADIENIEKVEYVFDTISVNILKDKYNLQSSILLDENQIIEGRFCKDDKIEIVIPDSFENSKDLLGKSIDVEYHGFVLNIEVVGIYRDPTKQGYCYISQSAIQEFMQFDKNIINLSACLIVIDNYNNLENIIQKIESKDLNANLYNTNGLNDIKTYKNISVILDVLIVFIILFTYATLIIIVSNILSNERKDIAILKALGYNQLHIIKIIFYRLFSIMLISFIIGILIQIYCEKIVQSFIIQTVNIDFKLCNYVIIFIILAILISIVSLKSGKKIKLINTITLLKE